MLRKQTTAILKGWLFHFSDCIFKSLSMIVTCSKTPYINMEEDTFNVLNGTLVINQYGKFYFSSPGNWFDIYGYVNHEKLHKEGGPAIEYATGDKEWWVNGKLHRENGPAIEYATGDKEWWVNGKLHREGGPAVEYASGDKEWWVNGVFSTQGFY